MMKCCEILLEYEDYINKDNYMGWTINKKNRWLSYGNMKLENEDSADLKYSINKYDPHPNKLGHEKIAKEDT